MTFLTVCTSTWEVQGDAKSFEISVFVSKNTCSPHSRTQTKLDIFNSDMLFTMSLAENLLL